METVKGALFRGFEKMRYGRPAAPLFTTLPANTLPLFEMAVNFMSPTTVGLEYVLPAPTRGKNCVVDASNPFPPDVRIHGKAFPEARIT